MAFLPFTGEDDNTDNPLQSILGGARNVGQGINDTLLTDPNSRAALLQIGLGLMQPQAQGQTTLGHIGQAIGSGGEALHRIEDEDIKRQKADDQLTIAELRMRAARDPNSLTEYQRQQLDLHREQLKNADKTQRRGDIREQRMTKKQEEDKIDELAMQRFKASRNIAAEENDPEVAQNKTKTYDQIRREIAAERGARDAVVNAAVPDDTEDVPQNLPPNAKMAPDGKYYVPDPKRPGKFLKVTR
jgi:hypothetical protein